MARFQKSGSTLVVHTKSGERVRFSGFYKVGENTYRSASLLGTVVTTTDGLMDYSFGRVKTIVVVPGA